LWGLFRLPATSSLSQVHIFSAPCCQNTVIRRWCNLKYWIGSQIWVTVKILLSAALWLGLAIDAHLDFESGWSAGLSWRAGREMNHHYAGMIMFNHPNFLRVDFFCATAEGHWGSGYVLIFFYQC
jgi:hypothetical protein